MRLKSGNEASYRSHHVIVSATPDNGCLLLGDINAANDPSVLEAFKVKTIVTAACGLDHLCFPSEITHIVFPLLDLKDPNIKAYFELSYRAIEENIKKGGVLIHCGAGISRSATLVLAYYMRKKEVQFKPALNNLLRINPNACPSSQFQLQLVKYGEQIKASTVGEKSIQKQSAGKQGVKYGLGGSASKQERGVEIDLKEESRQGQGNGFFLTGAKVSKMSEEGKGVSRER